MKIESLIRENIKQLAPYSTARDEYKGEIGIYLDANESPYDNGYNRYPDPRSERLKDRLSQIKGVAQDKIFIGNGSDEAIDLIFRIFCRPSIDNVVAISPSYGMYSVAADINDIQVKSVRLEADFSLDIKKIEAAIDQNTKAIFLCSPNNPSANSLERADIIALAAKYSVMVVVDEAYIDFANSPSLVDMIDSYPNIMVLQTLSKAWGMAAVRCGLAIADSEVIGYMNKVKYPYNINKLTQEWVFEALNPELVAEHVAQIKSERARLETELPKFSFVERVYSSDANFILVKVADADSLYNRLIDSKIIVRNRNRVEGCQGCLRITVGSCEENSRLLEILESL